MGRFCPASLGEGAESNGFGSFLTTAGLARREMVCAETGAAGLNRAALEGGQEATHQATMGKSSHREHLFLTPPARVLSLCLQTNSGRSWTLLLILSCIILTSRLH